MSWLVYSLWLTGSLCFTAATVIMMLEKAGVL